jgi:ubiquinone/menaquinone biosynthesis C-methylase UbiE
MKPGWTGERLETFVLNETTLEHLHRYAIAKELVKNKTVLDIACGEGYGSYLLADDSVTITGIDIDAETIEKAKIKYKKTNLVFAVGNVENIPATDAKYDVVVSFETLEHISNHDRMLSELKRVLKPTGLLIISTPDKLNYSDKPNYKNPFHERELYKTDFQNLVSHYFKNTCYLFQQSGLSSIIVPQSSAGTPITYKGDFNHITTENDFGALYIIAIASDNPLPQLPLSLFKSGTVLPMLLKEQRDAVRQTASYRLGHTLLRPLIFFLSVFKKRSGNK